MKKGLAIVTGASRGIGAATARRLAAEGYAVCVNYHQSEALAQAVVADIEKRGGKAIAMQADMGAEAEIVRLFAAAEKALGPLVALVNNAGVARTGAVADVQWEALQALFSANVFGVFIACREALARMKEGGAIVNISSEAARFGGNNMTAYAASKAAINAFTIGFAREAAARHIRVNAISPGVIDTDTHAGATPERMKALTQSIPLKRMGTADEIASMVAWLLSQEASYVTGSILPVTGGR